MSDRRRDPGEYGEHLYWITVMGEPSPTEPWGWQLEGHHLVISYFVLGDQPSSSRGPHPAGQPRTCAISPRAGATAVVAQ